MSAQTFDPIRRPGLAYQHAFDWLAVRLVKTGVTVLPSTTTREAFGLVPLKSLACGTPVITSNLPEAEQWSTLAKMGS